MFPSETPSPSVSIASWIRGDPPPQLLGGMTKALNDSNEER
jgi:hypothetical protein